MYTAIRHFYPRGIEGEAMDCTVKEFDDLDGAIKYARRYTSGLRFAGVQVEDDKGNCLFEITSDQEEYVYNL